MNLNLSLLDLSYNLLTHITKDTFTSVKTKSLDISNNKIVKIDNGAFQVMNLHHIYYQNNIGFINATRYWYIDNSQIEIDCTIIKTYRICIQGETLTSVDILNKFSLFKSSLTSFLGWLITSDAIEISDERISAMGKYVFKDLLPIADPKTLSIHKNIKSEFLIHPESFDGLLNLENLVLDVGPIPLEVMLFDRLTSLNYLKIEIKKNPKLPSEYINNVLNTVPSIRVLEILNSDSVNICDNPESFINILPITGLYYTGGLISTLPRNSLKCLRNLEKLSISETQLTTIEAGVFDSLDNLKYIHLAFNKINHISTGTFVNLNNLISLELNHNKINGIDDKSLMKSSNNNLQLVNLSYNEISIIKKDTFKGVYCIRLDLSHNKISHVENDAFEGTNIQDMFLFNNSIIDVQKKAWKIPPFTFVTLEKPFHAAPYCALRTGEVIHCDRCQFRMCYSLVLRFG
ncbi:leucine-rich repeats and immunoglobulin-like domains protein 1 [Aphidius gifuensis]|uniref:leucine-rich repeats and immunoglobulin-like domains protein 1 n=1 Tax=Aphidius gifuensis TaxID=684658 RepID=UPI001CDD1504|nr:leucine-rich repeats and immunoglobulin-like domains protein 1 [Aphidius gifuensis]